MKLAISRRKLNDFLYYAALIFYIFWSILFNTYVTRTGFWNENVVRAFIIIVRILLYIKILDDSYYLEGVIKAVVLAVLTYFSLINSGQNLIQYSVLFILAAKNIDLGKALKIGLVTDAVSTGSVVILSLLGVITNFSSDKGGTLRYAMGFNNANTFGGHIVILTLGFIYFYYWSFTIKRYLALILVVLLISITCRSRTALLLCVIGLLLVWLSRKFDIKVIYWITQISTILAPALSFALIFLARGLTSRVAALNLLSSGRVDSAFWYYRTYGMSWLGQKTSALDTSRQMNIALDNAYVTLGVKFGMVFLILFVIGYMMLANMARNSEDRGMLVILTLTAIWGIFETCNIRFEYNYFLMFLSLPLYEINVFHNAYVRSYS